mmetsp:Transcript_34677/g.81783  ORF Transcript_34677/g.81783 Transcript_34677/m.81783 type:complete len:714 (-) Transcript_34677:75-2216(-)
MNPKHFVQDEVIRFCHNVQDLYRIERGKQEYHRQHQREQQLHYQYHDHYQYQQHNQQLMVHGATSIPYAHSRQPSPAIDNNGTGHNRYSPPYGTRDSHHLATAPPTDCQPNGNQAQAIYHQLDPKSTLVSVTKEQEQLYASQRYSRSRSRERIIPPLQAQPDHRDGKERLQPKERKNTNSPLDISLDSSETFHQQPVFCGKASVPITEDERKTPHNGDGLLNTQKDMVNSTSASSLVSFLGDEIQALSTKYRGDYCLLLPFTSNTPMKSCVQELRSEQASNDMMMNDLFHSELKLSRDKNEGVYSFSDSDAAKQCKHQPQSSSTNEVSGTYPSSVAQLIVPEEQAVTKEPVDYQDFVPQRSHQSPELRETCSDTSKRKQAKAMAKGCKRKSPQRRKTSVGRKSKFPSMEEEPPIEQQISTLPVILLSPSLLANIVTNERKSCEKDSNPVTTTILNQCIKIANRKQERTENDNDRSDCAMSPMEVFRLILRGLGHDENCWIELEATEYDVVSSPMQLASFGRSLVWAVQSSNVALLRRLLNCGLSPNACNLFRDSVLSDLVCKKGNVSIYNCLVNEFHADLQVMDGFGRALLHHCCWAHELCEPIVEDILKRDPVQIFLKDKQGKTPLDYVRSENWGAWNRFLNEVAEKFWPKGSFLPQHPAAFGIRKQSERDFQDFSSPLSLVLVASVASGSIDPEEVAKMSEEERKRYGKKE